MKKVITIVAISTAFLASFHAAAGLINFELNASGGLPKDNEIVALNDVFSLDGVSVRFGFDTDEDGVLDEPAVFEEVGNTDSHNDTGFWGIGGAKDIAAPGFESVLGNFFLRQSEPYQPFGTFVILYDSHSPVTAASGEIWDIDGRVNATEQFTVKAFNNDTLLQTLLSPEGTDLTLDGQPWTFGFTALPNITRIEISFSGSKSKGIGLAFDNFSPVTSAIPPTTVQEPATLLLLLTPLLGLVFRNNPVRSTLTGNGL